MEGGGGEVLCGVDGVGKGGDWERSYPRHGGEGPYRPDSKAGDARGESSVVMVKMPSNLRSGRGAATEAEMRVRTLWMGSFIDASSTRLYHVGRIPRLAQANVCNAMVLTEGYVEVAVCIEGTAIEADILVKSSEEESALVDGGFWFARHRHESR